MSMSGYTKLFNSILASTIWREDNTTRIVWITMLAMADKYGVVEGSVPGLADMARVSVDDCRVALKKLQEPDPDSRSQENEGRRIAPTDGGWIILNHSKYRDKLSADERREYLREYQSRYRAKHKQAVNKCKDLSEDVRGCKSESTLYTHTEADPAPEATPEAEAEASTEPDTTPLPECKCASRYHKDSRTVLFYLNEKTGRHYRETNKNLTFISKRLSESGVDLAGVQKMIDRQVANWGGTEYAEYLRPSTLFNETKFDGYYAAKDCKPVDRKAGQHGAANRNLHMCGDDEEYREAGRKL